MSPRKGLDSKTNGLTEHVINNNNNNRLQRFNYPKNEQ
jgi:hypothetical protein